MKMRWKYYSKRQFILTFPLFMISYGSKKVKAALR